MSQSKTPAARYIFFGFFFFDLRTLFRVENRAHAVIYLIVSSIFFGGRKNYRKIGNPSVLDNIFVSRAEHLFEA